MFVLWLVLPALRPHPTETEGSFLRAGLDLLSPELGPRPEHVVGSQEQLTGTHMS